MSKPPFKKILIANRGEIALRIVRACHELGIKTVAVHSKADEDALHVKLASESVCIGPAPAKDSYLNIASILAAATSTGSEAIHPGYGFLSENASFAEICGSCGITFIGPSVRNMRVMGDKARARRAADKAGVPTIPGDSTGFIDAKEASHVARQVGFPILLKACAGGGGRGMKIIKDAESFASIFTTAQREVEAAFGDGHLLVEKYLPKVRHIEVQIAGDQAKNIVHLGIRDCSIQRRYQKVIEESPSIGLPDNLKEEIQNAAVELCASVNYTSVGTVEFLVDLEEKKFYFIEMNTRLQVEHPVTEMATDIDIVKEQIRIAAGREISFQQKDVHLRGHTIEARINAEDPHTLIPSPGYISSYHPPGGNGVRVDSALYSGYTVKPFYDSLVAKLIVRARDRESCIQKMLVALDEFIIEGIQTNVELHRRILNHEGFQSGKFHTKFLDEVKLFSSEKGEKEGHEKS
ncbi:MAG: acetyl-CoA carboxylase biotin carboxylase subunit [SAR324 cluster bacterium]|uniref:Biotin carboxylase n=1 Tax=SAR324 cluster bacterium TaxID=2024889 RepID=A0A7X9FS94_9DELT|nr:acetyl-CoA carboxylase biotin carboxylase subunit [SAR324 cluster bacterium]